MLLVLYHLPGREVPSTGWAYDCMDPSPTDSNHTNVFTHLVEGDYHLPEVAPSAFCTNT